MPVSAENVTAAIPRHYLGLDADTNDVWIPLVGLETRQYNKPEIGAE